MSQHKDPLLEALKDGRSYTWRVPEGGDLASMRQAIKHGQTLTMSPINDPAEIQAGDMVLVRWHKSTIFHLVSEIKDDQYLIINSLGKVNGWVSASDILGRITRIIEPEPRPGVPTMLEQLDAIYLKMIQFDQPADSDKRRVAAIIDDLHWYADRIGVERWSIMPRSNKWSFEQNLWKLTRQLNAGEAPVQNRLWYFIDQGKKCVGLASEIFALYEYQAINNDS